MSGYRIGGCIAISASESRTVNRQIFDDILLQSEERHSNSSSRPKAGVAAFLVCSNLESVVTSWIGDGVE